MDSHHSADGADWTSFADSLTTHWVRFCHSIQQERLNNPHDIVQIKTLFSGSRLVD
jgi:hypothetical protein